MRIGIDAKWYFNGPPSGRIVVRNLVDQIIDYQGQANAIYLFLEKQDKGQAMELWEGKNVNLIFLPKTISLISNAIILPYYARKYHLEAILFQNFSSLIKTKAKNIVYIHDFLFMDYPEYYSKTELLYFKSMLILAKKSDAIITISESEKARMLKYHIADASKISVVYHGINDKFTPLTNFSDLKIRKINDRYNLPKRYLLYVGRINIRKNLLNLIKGFHLSNNLQTHLVIVGKTDHKNIDINSYIQQNNLDDRVHFLGHVPDEDLYAIYARAHTFCFPSFAEGFGLPPLEAMKAGIPSIVSDRTALPEVCGDAAIYIDPDSALDIAYKINLLNNDEPYYESMKERSLLHSKKFSWKSAAENILNIISNTI